MANKVKGLATGVAKCLKKPWEITGPAASPEFRDPLPIAGVYRKHSPATPPQRLIVPHAEPKHVFDIKYYVRDTRRYYGRDTGRAPPKSTVIAVPANGTFEGTVPAAGVQPLDQETERKAGWMLKALAAVTFTYVGFNVFPLMGDSFVKHSVALLRTKDPMFRRSGASRLTLIATDDERRLRIVDAGGVGALVNMLQAASDDDTRREAAKALATLSECDAAVEALDKTGVQAFLDTLSTSSSDLEIQQHSLFLLARLNEWSTRTSQ